MAASKANGSAGGARRANGSGAARARSRGAASSNSANGGSRTNRCAAERRTDAPSPLGRAANALATLVATACLAITCVAAGFAACALPDTACEMLGGAFANETDSPFTRDELVTCGVVTKQYTFNTHDERALLDAVYLINRSAASDGRAEAGAPDLSAWAEGTPSLEEARAALEAADESYVLTPDAISHLDDVYYVVSVAYPLLAACAVIAVCGIVFLGARCGRRRVGGALAVSGGAVLALFAALAVWVAVDFNGFFAAFHSLFFAEGTWTFSWDSLLICMYPPEFWIGMGAVWLGVTAACCMLCIIVGALLLRRRGAAG